MCHTDMLKWLSVGKHWGVPAPVGVVASRGRHRSLLANTHGSFGPSQSLGRQSHSGTDSGLGMRFGSEG